MTDIIMESWYPNTDPAVLWTCNSCGVDDTRITEGYCVVENAYVDYKGYESIFVGRPVGTTASDTEGNAFDHWASYRAGSPALARMPPADFLGEACIVVPGTDAEEAAAATSCALVEGSCAASTGSGTCEYVAPLDFQGCTDPHCSADGRYYPPRCGGDETGTGTSGDVTTAAANGCRVIYGGNPSWALMRYMIFQIAARDLPLVVVWVGSSSNLRRFEDAAFAAGYDITLAYGYRPDEYNAERLPAPMYAPVLSENFCAENADILGGCSDFVTDSMPKTSRLSKLISGRLDIDGMPEVRTLLDTFDVTNDQVNALLDITSSTPGIEDCATPGRCGDVYERAACTWLMENPAVWGPSVAAAQTKAVDAEAERAERAVMTVLIIICAAVVSLVCIVLLIRFRWRRETRRQERLARSTNGHYTTFISHSKNDGGQTAQTFHTAFNEALLQGTYWMPTTRGPNFIDTVELTNITMAELIEAVKHSKVFVLLLTKEVLTRTWCLLEIYTALDHGIPIVPVLVQRQNAVNQYSYRSAASFLQDLERAAFNEAYMRKHFDVPAWGKRDWEGIEQGVRTKSGEALTLRKVQDLLSSKLPSQKAEKYDPNANPKMIKAAEEVIIERIEKILAGEHQQQTVVGGSGSSARAHSRSGSQTELLESGTASYGMTEPTDFALSTLSTAEMEAELSKRRAVKPPELATVKKNQDQPAEDDPPPRPVSSSGGTSPKRKMRVVARVVSKSSSRAKSSGGDDAAAAV